MAGIVEANLVIAREAQQALTAIELCTTKEQVENVLNDQVGVKALYRLAVELGVGAGQSKAKRPELTPIVVEAAWLAQQAKMAEAAKVVTLQPRRNGEEIKKDRATARKAPKSNGGTGGPTVKMTDDQVTTEIEAMLTANAKLSCAGGLANLRGRGLSVAQARFRTLWQAVVSQGVEVATEVEVEENDATDSEGGEGLTGDEAKELAEADAGAQADADAEVDA